MYTMGSLFAGIGGFDLGFERAGFKTSWQVEIDPYCQKVLAKNFPEAERFGDIRECGSNNLKPVDVICGGFPCQDISNAGKRAGIEGERSGLWSEYARIIGELRPRFVLVENVAALLGRGMGVVLGDLASLGYDAEWEVISAADMGAPHLRERVWLLAYPAGERCREARGFRHNQPAQRFAGCRKDVSHAHVNEHESGPPSDQWPAASNLSTYTQRMRGPQWLARSNRRGKGYAREPIHGDYARRGEAATSAVGWWATEPNMGRVAHGVSKRVDRLRGLGNAVIPQIPEMIARRIKQALDEKVA